MQMTQHRGTWGTYTSQTKQKIRIVVIFIGFAGFFNLPGESLVLLPAYSWRPAYGGTGLKPQFLNSDAGGAFSFC